MSKRILYACGVDWQCEIGEASDLEGKMPLYSSISFCKRRGRVAYVRKN